MDHWLAPELEGKAKQQLNKAESAIKNQVPQSAGGNKIELYSGKFYAVSALGGIVACGATHTLGEPSPGFAKFLKLC